MSHKGFCIEIFALPFRTALVQTTGCPSLPVPAFLPAGGEEHRFLACVLWPVPGRGPIDEKRRRPGLRRSLAPITTRGGNDRSCRAAAVNAPFSKSSPVRERPPRITAASGRRAPPRVTAQPRHAAPGRGLHVRFLR